MMPGMKIYLNLITDSFNTLSKSYVYLQSTSILRI